MNAKRQTIWLVSMLSLMVILSAYYLFTEDVNKLDTVSTDAAGAPQAIQIDLKEGDPTAAAPQDAKKEAQPSALADAKAGATAKTEAKAEAKAAVKPDAKPDAKTDAKAAAKTGEAKTDSQVLEQVKAQATSASDFFTNEQMKRHDILSKETEKWMTIATDAKQKPEAAAQAVAELEKISDMTQKVENVEDILMKDFGQALVTQEGKKWKVTVQAEKLEKSQGVTIVDLLEKELGAAPENVKIQYVKP